LTEDQERALGLKVRDHEDGDAAKKLVVHNLRLALKMAHQHRRSWTNLMDLVQEASAGMAIAAQRWDPDQGTRFGTYAVYWIRAQLTKFLMTHGRIIHTGSTRAGRKLYFQLPQIRRRLLAAGKEPTVEAIAEEVGESTEEVTRILNRLDGREASLSAPLGSDEESGTLGDVIAGEQLSPENRVGNEEANQLIRGVVERFAQTLQDERDLAICREHLVSDEPVSLVEFGNRYGVSKQRMGQLATRLKRAFRRHIIDELGPNTQLHWLFRQD
jgi:RNA polymerase sigma-32 factor